MTFTEGWFDVPSQETIAELAQSCLDVPGVFVEIGAWEGRSTVALANAIHPKTLHTVDTWTGADSDVTGRLAGERDVFATWAGNVDQLTLGNVVAHRMDWRDYIPTVREPIAFCFIDAEHTYDEVYDNIMCVLPRMARGGVLCGDDIKSSEVSRGVSHALREFSSHGAVWSWVKP